MLKAKDAIFRSLVKSEDGSISRVGEFLEAKAKAILARTKRLRTEHRYNHRAPQHCHKWPFSLDQKLVFDCGANDGRNIAYYLSRGMHVVAVEANPELARLIASEYEDDSRVAVVNACVLPEEGPNEVDFFINKERNYLSRLTIREEWASEYTKTQVATTTMKKLLESFGTPAYLKIDIEGMDGPILKSTLELQNSIPYISAEMHTIDPFCHLVHFGYKEFKFVEAEHLGKDYYDIPEDDGCQPVHFEQHDAGPFGEDIPGQWMNENQAFEYLTQAGLGWRDIHARKPLQ